MSVYSRNNYRWITIPWVTAALAAAAWAVHLSATLTVAFQFERNALAHGQLWRFLTAHLTHFGADHLRWDLLAFVALGTMAECISRRGYALTLGFASLVITAGVWVWQPQFETYRGLSGIDSALAGFVIADLLVKGVRTRHGFSIALACIGLVGFAAKCTFELSTGGTVFVDPTSATASAAFVGVPLAHLLGMITGAAVGGFANHAARERRMVSPSHERTGGSAVWIGD